MVRFNPELHHQLCSGVCVCAMLRARHSLSAR
jgi:hypothetical protein